MKIQYFVFNYGHFAQAMQLFNGFMSEGCDVYLLNCASPKDPQFEETDRVKKFGNIYYSGQWNEALKLFNADVIFITNADVGIRSIPNLISKMTNFYEIHGEKAGLYAPNHYWTPWTYNPSLLEDIGNGIKKVPATDSTIWSVRASIARTIGEIDLNVNKLGWGIEILAAWYCHLENRFVVRDYSIKCEHPKHTSYDRNKADIEWRNMARKLGLGSDFWQYYNSRSLYGFGWSSNKSEIKLL